LRTDVDGRPASVASLGNGQLAARTIEQDHVPGIDQVRVSNLLPVHVPQLRPAPGGVVITLRDTPQGISGYHHITVTRGGLERQRRLRWLSFSDAGREEESQCCDRLTELQDHGDPVFLAAFLDRLENRFLHPNVA